jgi:hypothetical protein
VLTHSPTHPPTRPPAHPLTHSLTRSRTHPLTHSHSPTLSPHQAYLLAHARLLHAPPAALAHLPILLQELGRHLDRAAAPAPAAAVAPAAPLPRAAPRAARRAARNAARRAARNAAPPPLLPRAAVARLAPPRLWGQLVRCERARRLAAEGAATEGAALRADVAAASLNPLQTFASQARP